MILKILIPPLFNIISHNFHFSSILCAFLPPIYRLFPVCLSHSLYFLPLFISFFVCLRIQFSMSCRWKDSWKKKNRRKNFSFLPFCVYIYTFHTHFWAIYFNLMKAVENIWSCVSYGSLNKQRCLKNKRNWNLCNREI